VGHHGDSIVELPISVADMMGKAICFFGGGYLRLFPYWLIRQKAKEVLAEGRPVVFYIHPREIDPTHPRLPMSRGRAFKSYVNLNTTEWKVRQVLKDFPVTTFQNALTHYPELVHTHVA
jgi:hypothetical protein